MEPVITFRSTRYVDHTILLMKGGEFSHGAVYEIRLVRIIRRIGICFLGDKKFIRCLGIACQDGLTTQDDEFICLRH